MEHGTPLNAAERFNRKPYL